MIQGIIFDLDGTLADTVDSLAYSGNKALEAVGFPPLPNNDYKYFAGDGADELVRRILRASGDEECTCYEKARAKYAQVFDALYLVEPYEGIEATIQALKKSGIKLAVLSNKPHEKTIEVVETLFGKDTFDIIVGQHPDRNRKPSPDGVFYICKELGIPLSEILYVGDTSTDMKTGKSAGVYTVGVLWGFRTREELEENHADVIISHPMELMNVVGGTIAKKQWKVKPGIKLIATDVDGTLVKDSSPEVDPEIPELIHKLVEKGIVFVVASGRAYNSVRTMFSAVENEIAYIVENGAHIVYQGKTLKITNMKREDTMEILTDLRACEGCDYVISTPEGSLMETDNEEFISLIRDGYHNKYRIVDDISKEDCDIIKLAIFRKGSNRKLGDEYLIPKWKDRVKACMAGEEWVDFMDKEVDKGNALRYLQNYLGIKDHETMAFGDNGNDVGLISAAGEGYAVENAIPEVKAVAKYICPSYEKKGVAQVLRELLKQYDS